jgi:L-alanine-DL-glutamate epimerase-like enolase superfamily enzyme
MECSPISALDVQIFEIPTDLPEADGTLSWDSTTMVLVTVRCEETTGIGWTYAGTGSKTVIEEKLAAVVVQADPMNPVGVNQAMAKACRNLGRPGLVACAISAVDTALWDLKARLLDLSLAQLFGRCRPEAPIYGSGGFTTYDDAATRNQLERWTAEWDIPRVKIKIGESWGCEPARDLHRVDLMREVVGSEVETYVDANGAYSRKQAIRLGRTMVEDFGVSWFEEPVSSDDLDGLREVRDQCGADVAAGEYGYSLAYFAQLLDADAVDCLQVDVTRCGGYTEWLRAAAVAQAKGLQVSGHCAPNLHAHVGVAVPNLRHLEYFHDHHRIETTFFDGTLPPHGGRLTPRLDAPGHGLTLKSADADRYRVA